MMARPAGVPRLRYRRLSAIGIGPFAATCSNIAVDPINQSVGCIAQQSRAFGDSIEHRLDIRWRAGDHTKDLAGRRLLL